MTEPWCRKRVPNLGTFISNPHCSADPLPDYWPSIFYAAVQTKQAIYCLGPVHFVQARETEARSRSPQLKVMTFKWARSNVADPSAPLDGQMSQEVNGILIEGQLNSPLMSSTAGALAPTQSYSFLLRVCTSVCMHVCKWGNREDPTGFRGVLINTMTSLRSQAWRFGGEKTNHND